MKQIKLSLVGLDCPNCASKIETEINSLKHVKEANLNFTMGTLVVGYNEEMDYIKAKDEMESIVHGHELDVSVEDYNKNNKCSNNSCSCYEEDEHQHGGFDKEDLIKIIIGAIIYVLAICFKEIKLN